MTKDTKKTVWETLSTIDVSGHAEEKNGFTYLSWAWAWQILKDHYPNAWYTKHTYVGGDGNTLPYMLDPKGYAYVQVTVTVPGDAPEDEVSATEVFPVLDHANKAICEPNAFQVNTALQRCMTKAISLLGLGAYIYAGEDLPPVAKDKEVTINDPQGAETKKASGPDMIFSVFENFMGLQNTVADLEKFYSGNVEAIAVLQRADPQKYEKMLSLFKKRKNEIMDAEKEKSA